MTDSRHTPPHWVWVAGFIATALLSIGPLWLVSRDIWDGIIGSYGIAIGDLAGIYDWLVPGNWDLMYAIFRSLSWLTNHLAFESWIAAKLLLTLSVLGIAWEARRLAIDLLGMTQPEGWAVSMLALSFPCWYLLYGSTFVYIVFIWWGFLGHRLLHAPATESRWHRPKQCLGYLLMLTSFQVNSNFVMVCALEAARWLARKPTVRWNYRRSALVCATAVLVYLMLRFVFTTTGNYAGYNNLIWPISAAGAIAWLRAGLMFMTWIPLVIGPACLVWLAANWLKTRGLATKNQGDVAQSHPVALSSTMQTSPKAFGILALLCMGALFAYIAVGKGAPLFVINVDPKFLGTATHLGSQTTAWFYTAVDGWSARHTFLLSVPASLTSAWLIKLAIARIGSTASASGLWVGGVAVAVLTHLAWQWHGHGAKQLRFAQEAAIVKALQAQAPPPAGLIDIKINGLLPWSLWTYEANYLTWLAYGQTRWATVVYTPGTGFVETVLQDRNHLLHGTGPMRGLSRTYALMTDFKASACQTEFVMDIPNTLNHFSWSRAVLGGNSLPPATVLKRHQSCIAQ
ncbi:MAG: hypothetical protein ACKVIH_05265 [Burkholderiales bacterium]